MLVVTASWHLPNTAHATTVQGGHAVFTDGYVELGFDRPGVRATAPCGITEINPLFLCEGADGRMDGYGVSHPGRLLRDMARRRQGETETLRLLVNDCCTHDSCMCICAPLFFCCCCLSYARLTVGVHPIPMLPPVPSQGLLSPEAEAKYYDPFIAGFWTTVVLECATKSLESSPPPPAPGVASEVIAGSPVDVASLLEDRLGVDRASACLTMKRF